MLTVSMFGGVGVVVGRASVRLIAGVDGEAKLVSIVQYTDAGVKGEVVEVAKVVKSESEWRRQVTPIQFEVTRHEGPERPFPGETWEIHDKWR